MRGRRQGCASARHPVHHLLRWLEVVSREKITDAKGALTSGMPSQRAAVSFHWAASVVPGVGRTVLNLSGSGSASSKSRTLVAPGDRFRGTRVCALPDWRRREVRGGEGMRDGLRAALAKEATDGSGGVMVVGRTDDMAEEQKLWLARASRTRLPFPLGRIPTGSLPLLENQSKPFKSANV